MTDLVGKTIAGYQIVEIIDDAARTLVYKGFQPSTNNYVAVKVLKPGAARDQAVVQSFTQYAQLAASMQHPNILPVLSSGQENGAYYLVTPFMQYRSVADNLSSYADLYQAQALLGAILPGLEYIYGQGYVHGNLRPTNIILGDQGQPLLADFAIAMRQGETPSPYNSPEQVQGGIVDQRTDVYALGVILFQLLTGGSPAPGTLFSLSAARPDLPKGVERVILKATAQNPEQRFQTPREFLSALQAAVSQPVPAPAPAPVPGTISQTVQVQEARSGPNWPIIAFVGLVVAAMCLCMVLAGPMVLDFLRPQAGATQPAGAQPTQPPAVQPTQLPTALPTQPPAVQPTQPPAVQPTQPPAALPTQPPEMQPTQPPQAEQPPAPYAPPAQGGGGGLPVCGSLGLGGGIVLMGGALTFKRRKRT